jgi:hypothetical protein
MRVLTVGGEEGDGSTGLACTTGAADTMDVVLRVVGVVVVEDVSDVADILKSETLVSHDRLGSCFTRGEGVLCRSRNLMGRVRA